MESDLINNMIKMSPFGYAGYEIITNRNNGTPDYVFVEANEAFGKMTGLNVKKIIGKKAVEVVFSLDKDFFNRIELYGKIALEKGNTTIEQYWGPLKKWYKIHVFSQGDGCFATLFFDITDMKEKNIELENFFSVNLDLLCIADTDGNFIKVNKEWEYVLGYKAKELEQRRFLDFVHPDDVTSTLAAMKKLDNQHKVLNFINRYRCEDGTYKYIEWRSHPKGELIYAAARDITEKMNNERELAFNEKKYRTIFEQFQDLYYQTDLEGRLIEISPSVKNLTGYSREELMGKPVVSLYENPFDRNEFLREIKKNGYVQDYHVTLIKKNGDKVFVSLNSHVIKNKEQLPESIGGTLRDVSEQKKVEMELKKSRDQFQSLVDNVPGVIYRCLNDRYWTTVYISGEIEKISGFSWKGFINNAERNFKNIVLPEDRGHVNRMINNAIRKNENWEIDYRIFHRDGSIRWVFDKGKGVYNEDGTLKYLDGIIYDITEKKKLMKELRKSEKKYRSIIENMTNCYYRTNLQGELIMVSPSAAGMFGYGSTEEMLGLSLSKNFYMVPAAREKFLKALKENNGKLAGYENGLKKKNGDDLYVISSSSYYYDEEGNVAGVEGVFSDITEKKVKDKILKENERRFHQLFDNMSNGVAIFEVQNNGNDFIFRDLNKQAEKIERIRKEDILNKNVVDVFPAVEKFGLYDVFQRVWKTGKPEMLPMTLYQDHRLKGWRENYVAKISENEIVSIYSDLTEEKKKEEEIRIQKEKLENIINGTRAGTWEWNVQTGKIKVNDYWAKIIGYEESELSPLNMNTWMKLIHPEDVEKSRVLLESFCKGEQEIFENKYRMRRKDGKWGWVLDKGKISERTNDGRPLWAYGTHMDISKSMKMEEDVYQTSRKLKTLMKSVQAGIMLVRAKDNIVVEINEKAADLMGRKIDEIIGTPCTAFICPDLNECPIKLRRQGIENSEREVLSASGERIPVLKTVKPIEIEGEEYYLESFVDISSQKESERLLQESKLQFELAINGTNDGIFDWNIKTGYLFLSKRWKEILGYKDHELKNEQNTFFSLLYEKDKTWLEPKIQAYLKGDIKIYCFEFRMKHKDGSLRWILAKGEAVRDDRGVPYRMAGSHSDITEKKEAEKELRENKSRLELAIDAGEHGFWDWDLVTGGTYFSPTYYTMLGYKDRELPMCFDTFDRLIHPEDKRRVLPVINEKVGGGGTL